MKKNLFEMRIDSFLFDASLDFDTSRFQRHHSSVAQKLVKNAGSSPIVCQRGVTHMLFLLLPLNQFTQLKLLSPPCLALGIDFSPLRNTSQRFFLQNTLCVISKRERQTTSFYLEK